MKLTEITAKQLYEKLSENTKQKYLRGILNPNVSPTIFDSKVGGVPYWDLSMPYPRGKNNAELIFLAQVNLETLPENKFLPHTGMLQFFIACDDMYGLSLDDDDSNIRVIYHKTINRNITKEQVQALNILTTFDKETDSGEEVLSPVEGELELRFEAEEGMIGLEDYTFDAEVEKAVAELGLELSEQPSVCDIIEALPDHLYNEWIKQSEGTKMFGYPFFTQNDPRKTNSPYSILLFQLDSFSEKGNKNEICWGDCGIGNFFIKPKDLQTLNFNDVLYNWDCT